MNYNYLNRLINKLKSGKQNNFEDFYNETKLSVFYTIKKFCSSKTRTEDIMQETYIKFMNSIQYIKTNQNPYSYLLTIAKNCAIDEFRKNKNISYIDNFDDVEAEPFEKDFPLLNHCKKVLSDEEFKILELTIIIGYKRVEVAKLLNQPISTVNWKYNKILKKIKTLYKEVYDENR